MYFFKIVESYQITSLSSSCPGTGKDARVPEAAKQEREQGVACIKNFQPQPIPASPLLCVTATLLQELCPQLGKLTSPSVYKGSSDGPCAQPKDHLPRGLPQPHLPLHSKLYILFIPLLCFLICLHSTHRTL